MTTRGLSAPCCALLLLGLAAARPAAAQTSWQYRLFPAGSTFYQPVGINDAGTVAGRYSSNAASGNFIEQGGVFTLFGDISMVVTGINNAGVTTGYITDPNGGDTAFVRAADGTVTDLPAKFVINDANGLNDVGGVVGNVTDDFVAGHGAVWSDGGPATIYDYPGADDTAFFGINNAGKIIGNTNFLSGNPGTAFVLDNGVFTALSGPGGSALFANGINNADQILGVYSDGGNGHGVILDKGAFTTLDFPDIGTVFGPTFTDSTGKVYDRQSTFTSPSGLNDRGDFVGLFGATYTGADGEGSLFTERGFVATAVPEPSSLAVLAGGLVMLGGVFVRRRRI